MVLLLCFFTLLLLTNSIHGECTKSAADCLVEDVIKCCDPKVRPVKNASDLVNVTLQFNYLGMQDVSEVQTTVSINFWINVSWIDEFRVWNPDNYSRITVVHPTSSQMWKPTFLVANGVGARYILEESKDSLVVFHDGGSRWYPGSMCTFSCALDMTYYPFDWQSCFLTIFPTDYVNEINLLLHETPVLFSSGFNWGKHPEWKIEDIKAEYFASTEGLPEHDRREGFHLINYIIELRRRPGFVLLNMIIPVNILSLLSVLTFLIPNEGGEKISYSVTLLLAVGLYMNSLSENLPRSSEKIPIVVIHLFCLLVFCSLNMLVAILSVRFSLPCCNFRNKVASQSDERITEVSKINLNGEKEFDEKDTDFAEKEVNKSSNQNYNSMSISSAISMLNFFFLIVFSVIWAIMTIVFFSIMIQN